MKPKNIMIQATEEEKDEYVKTYIMNEIENATSLSDDEIAYLIMHYGLA